MIRLFVCFLFFILSLGITHNGYTYTVEEIFTKFQNAYNNSENFSAEFEEITLYGDRKSVTIGRFIFARPNLLRKEYISKSNEQKITKTIVLDGSYAWSYVPLLNQVNKMKLNQPERGELLPGAGASLEDISNNYTMKLIPDKDVNPKGIYHINLIPKTDPLINNTNLKQNSSNKEILEIWVKDGDWLPVQFGHVLEFDDGTRRSVIVKMKNINRDKILPPDVFKFETPKNAEVIDLSN